MNGAWRPREGFQFIKAAEANESAKDWGILNCSPETSQYLLQKFAANVSEILYYYFLIIYCLYSFLAVQI